LDNKVIDIEDARHKLEEEGSIGIQLALSVSNNIFTSLLAAVSTLNVN
jgi:hypothetical protein